MPDDDFADPVARLGLSPRQRAAVDRLRALLDADDDGAGIAAAQATMGESLWETLIGPTFKFLSIAAMARDAGGTVDAMRARFEASCDLLGDHFSKLDQKARKAVEAERRAAERTAAPVPTARPVAPRQKPIPYRIGQSAA